MENVERTALGSGEERFRLLLQKSLGERIQRNPKYSLRAFANSLEMNHGTLLQILNGTRKLGEPVKIDVVDRQSSFSADSHQGFSSSFNCA